MNDPYIHSISATLRILRHACLLLSACAFAQNGGSEIAAQEAKLVVLERLWNDAQVHRDARA